MSPLYPLNELRPGQCALVQRLDTQGAMRRRLMDLGFLPGAAVQPLYRACFGDICAYLIGGAVIALRGCDAATVQVHVG